MNANQNPKSKTVLVTGGSDRLGLELAKECLDIGYHVVIHYRTSADPARSFFVDDDRVSFIQADLLTVSLEKFFDDVMTIAASKSSALAGLINNAAIFEEGDMSDTNHFVNTLMINTIAPLKLSAEFAKRVICDDGWIINITDARINRPNKKYQNYRTSKIFLDELTRQLAFLHAPQIRINAIAPGIILPPPNEPLSELTKSVPMNKIGNTNNIRQTARFLIENNYVTGSVIPVDGGWHLS